MIDCTLMVKEEDLGRGQTLLCVQTQVIIEYWHYKVTVLKLNLKEMKEQSYN